MKVIAEIGSNFKTLEDCFHSIEAAKRSGADIVKFQYFTSYDLYGRERRNMQGELPDFWLGSLKNEADANEIEFMCTAFSPEGYIFIDQYVTRHKVASAEITDLDILKTVNGFKKPVLLSTGGATFQEIDRALNHLPDCEVTLMYCVPAYPARVVDFRLLGEMREIFGDRSLYGYSDHSLDVLIVPSCARSHGAVILEKHVNFTEHTDTPDAPHSLSEAEFKLMMRHLKGESTISDTFTPCTWKRKLITLPNGTEGYYRPLPDGE